MGQTRVSAAQRLRDLAKGLSARSKIASYPTCKRVTVFGRCNSKVLALTRRGVSAALCAQYILDLREIVEQHKLIVLHPHPFTVPSFVATNPLTILICQPIPRIAAWLGRDGGEQSRTRWDGLGQ